MAKELWRPSAERIARANLTRFMKGVQSRGHREVVDYDSLYWWSIAKPLEFWPAVWEFCDLRASRRWDAVAENFGEMPAARWFTGARLNFAENLLRYRDERDALVFWNERGRQSSLTFSQLFQRVQQTAAALRAVGVQAGDRVAGFMPNLPETVIAMLGAAALGAVWSSTSPDFGLQGALDRLSQIAPKVLIAADGYIYQGQTIDSLERVSQIARQLPSIEKTVIVSYTRPDPPLANIRGAIGFEEFLASAPSAERELAQLPFDHPLYILYSSGTTGPPKCIVHGAGGTLLQHLKELVLHTDLTRDDRIFYFTTCGWMMWNWLVSSLAAGATVVLYDGSPLSKHAGHLFDMAQQERITVFGTSARYLAAIAKEGLQPRRTHDLAPLRTILSTGSALAPESFDYVYEHVKPDVQLASISGGTDLISCFALGNPLAPVFRGELQCRGLGMNVQVFSDDGRPLVGKRGELVCVSPFPSMPVGFWNDPGGERYRAAYFEHFPGVWRHGDYVELTERGTLIFYGRSDTTLNPGGVRIGAGEIYRQVEQVPEVLESVAIGQDWKGDQRIVLFVKLRPSLALDEDLAARIRVQIRENATPRHVPRKIVQVADIPRTISGKIVELAVRDVVHGRPVKNREALANPQALDLFRDLPELREQLRSQVAAACIGFLGGRICAAMAKRRSRAVDQKLFERGFLPPDDPARSFPVGSELAMLDEIGRDLPSLLYRDDFRKFTRELEIPPWLADDLRDGSLPLLRLYYVRLGFLASAYINQVSQPRATLLPRNIAVPLCRACRLLQRPPILSYDGYALYNWKRFDPAGPIALGNIDTLQNFVHLYDEHWFILVHVEIEAISAAILAAVARAGRALDPADPAGINCALRDIARAVWQQVAVLRRIPEHMDPAVYFKTFRPYIRFFEGVVYEGVDEAPLNFRGETGAQSSIMPLLVAFLKIPHRPSLLTNHLADMRQFMPAEHRRAIEAAESLAPLRHLAEKDVFNDLLEAVATFREVHYGWAQEYIHSRVDDPRGTGGTPYMQWLQQLIDETRAFQIP